MRTLIVVKEKNKDGYWLRVEGVGRCMCNGYGDTMKLAVANLKEMIQDHIDNEGQDDTEWLEIVKDGYELEFISQRLSEIIDNCEIQNIMSSLQKVK